MSDRPLHERSRGQALLEFAATLPIYLGLFFALFWACRTAVLQERAQQLLRYSGTVLTHSSPYTDNSSAALYTDIRGAYPIGHGIGCFAVGSESLSATAVDGRSSSSFFNPWSSKAPSCAQATAFFGGDGYREPLIALIGVKTTIGSSTINRQGLSSAAQLVRPFTSSQYSFRGADLMTQLQCYPDLQTAANDTIDASHDADNSTSFAGIAPLGDPVAATRLPVSANCK